MDNLPAVRETVELAQHFARSGYFMDARQESQAVVKIIAGRELGIGAFQSMAGLYIVKGRVTMSANLLASLIKRNAKYDYRVRELTNTACKLEFFERGESIGVSEFSIEDARRAGLAGGDNWKNYPKNMLFARALSNGAKWCCPDVTESAVYTPDELGLTIDGETGEVIDAPEPAQPQPARDDSEYAGFRDKWERMRAKAAEWDIPVSPFPEGMGLPRIREAYKNVALATAAEIERVKALRAQEEAAAKSHAELDREMAAAAADDEPDIFADE